MSTADLLRLNDRPACPEQGKPLYLVQAWAADGTSLDLNGTAEGEPHYEYSTKAAVWAVENLRWGVAHDWDADTHALTPVAGISLHHLTGGKPEIFHIIGDVAVAVRA